VKDLNGNVTCPTLLSQECRYCHKKGHTTSHCASLKKQKESEENSRRPHISPSKKETPAPKRSNVFAYLEINSDDESDDEAEKFPVLVAAEPKDLFEKETLAPKKFSYASIVAKTQSEYKAEKILEENKPAPIVEEKLKIVFASRYVGGIDTKTGKKFSWVDADSDSEGDDEEEDLLAEDNSTW
jgi:hypothetical protein